MKIQNSHLKALVSLTDKNDVRYYVNRVAVHGNLAYASNAHVALRVPVTGENHEKLCFDAEKLEMARQLEELNKKAEGYKANYLKVCDLSLDNVEPTSETYPPVEMSYRVAEEQRDTILASYDLDDLLALLNAIKTASTQKIKTVTLTIGDVKKPMIIRLKESGVTGIIVPSYK